MGDNSSNDRPQWATDLTNTMADIARSLALMTANAQQPPPLPPPPPPPQDTGSSATDNKPRWKAEEVGYFYPHLEDSYGLGDFVNVGRDVFYRSVEAFIDRVHDVAADKGEALVTQNLSTCLRGPAQTWYTSELSDESKVAMRSGLRFWIDRLRGRFRLNPAEATDFLKRLDYGYAQVSQGKTPGEYLSTMFRYGKEVGMSDLGIMLYAYQGIHIDFRVQLIQPTQSTTREEFASHLEQKTYIWQEQTRHHYAKNTNSGRSRDRYSSRSSQAQPRSVAFVDEYDQRQSRSTNNFWDKKREDKSPSGKPLPQLPATAPLLLSSKPTLLLTDGTTAAPKKSDKSSSRDWRKDRKERTSSFHADNDSSDGDSASDEDTAVNRIEISQGEGDPTEVGCYNADADTITCRKCLIVFPSRSALHRHLKAGCESKRGKWQKKNAAYALKKAAVKNEPLPTENIETTVDPVVESTDTIQPDSYQSAANHAAVDLEHLPNGKDLKIIKSPREFSPQLGRHFASFKWASLRVALTPISSFTPVCIDTGCPVSIIDRTFLLTHLPDVEIKSLAKSLNLTGINGGRHASNEYVEISFYVPGYLGEEIQLIQITSEIHVVPSLPANMLIAVNIIDP